MTAGAVKRDQATRRFALLLTLVLGLVAGVISPAAAHDALIDSSPKSGATVDTAPTEVTLTFAEPAGDAVAPTIVVTGPDGSQLESGAPLVEGTTIRQALLPTSEPGAYDVAFRVVSADGHPISGAIEFTVSAQVAPPAVEEPEPDANASTPAAPSAAAGSTAPVQSSLASAGSSGPSPKPSSSEMVGAPMSNSSDGGSSPWPWVIGGVAVLALLGAGGYLAWSRAQGDGRTAEPGDL